MRWALAVALLAVVSGTEYESLTIPGICSACHVVDATLFYPVNCCDEGGQLWGFACRSTNDAGTGYEAFGLNCSGCLCPLDKPYPPPPPADPPNPPLEPPPPPPPPAPPGPPPLPPLPPASPTLVGDVQFMCGYDGQHLAAVDSVEGLEAAVADASVGCIKLAPVVFALTSRLRITRSVALVADDGPAVITQGSNFTSAQTLLRLEGTYTYSPSPVVIHLSGLAFCNATVETGAVYSSDVATFISHCTFTNLIGGAIYNWDPLLDLSSRVTVTDSVFADNVCRPPLQPTSAASASSPSPRARTPFPPRAMTAVAARAQSAPHAGAIFTYGSLSVSRCVFARNVATDYFAGAVWVSPGADGMTSSFIDSNFTDSA